jgi:hypothetical protein
MEMTRPSSEISTNANSGALPKCGKITDLSFSKLSTGITSLTIHISAILDDFRNDYSYEYLFFTMPGRGWMVSERVTKKSLVYLCELCGFGYSDIDTAERCEHYCYSHDKPSPRITKKAIRKPSVQLDPIPA